MSEKQNERRGPLTGTNILEVGGIGPLPMYGMLMADLGARIIRIDRREPGPRTSAQSWMFRGRESLTLDISRPEGVSVLLDLADRSDILVEGFRPGVAERLGFGPDICLGRNPKLVYGRVTGLGGHGPLADKGGHDINYIAISGALAAMGPSDRPPPVPLNLAGDYGGGAMMLAFGTLAALFEAQQTGIGQTVEAAMSDGALSLMSQFFTMRENNQWTDLRENNLIDGGAPFYRCYETQDGGYVAVGAIEGKFYADLLKGLGLDLALADKQSDTSTWPALRDLFATIFKTRPRAEWETIFADLDACFSPVLSMSEALEYPHNVERGIVVEQDGKHQIGPPVRFSLSKERIAAPPPDPGDDNDRLLGELGLSENEIASLRERSIIG